jgi:hypothetical protein
VPKLPVLITSPSSFYSTPSSHRHPQVSRPQLPMEREQGWRGTAALSSGCLCFLFQWSGSEKASFSAWAAPSPNSQLPQHSLLHQQQVSPSSGPHSASCLRRGQETLKWGCPWPPQTDREDSSGGQVSAHGPPACRSPFLKHPGEERHGPQAAEQRPISGT